MGSFNTTCFASQQTIAPGDACFVWPLIQSAGYSPVEVVRDGEAQEIFGVASSVSYPTRFWKPFGCPISGEYFDYGQIRLDDALPNRHRILHWLCTLFAQNIVVKQGENPCHDVAFDFRATALELAPSLRSIFEGYLTPGISAFVRMPTLPEGALEGAEVFKEMTRLWEYMWERFQEQRLFGYMNSGELRPAGFAIMHQAAYRCLIAMAEEGDGWSGVALERRALLTAAVEKGREEVQAYLAEGTKTGDMMARTAMHRAIREDLDQAGRHPGILYYAEIHALDATLWEQMRTGAYDEAKLVDRLYEALDMRYLMAGLERVNQHLSPMVYAGQDYSNEIGQDYAKFVSHICESVTAQRERDTSPADADEDE